jgi:hypothetical protein
MGLSMEERTVRKKLGAFSGALLLSMWWSAQAQAQVYEFIKWCRGSWQTTVACIVVEKGVEITVEKTMQEWLTQWNKGEGRAIPPNSAPPSKDWVDFRTIMLGPDNGATPSQDASPNEGGAYC